MYRTIKFSRRIRMQLALDDFFAVNPDAVHDAETKHDHAVTNNYCQSGLAFCRLALHSSPHHSLNSTTHYENPTEHPNCSEFFPCSGWIAAPGIGCLHSP